MKKFGNRILYILGATAVVLAGCGGSGSSDTNATGFISLSISDGPVHDAKKVCISFDEIEFKGNGQSIIIELDPAESVNLLEFQGNNAMPILISEELPAGEYQWLRLGIDAKRLGMGGTGDSSETECDGEGSYIVMKTGEVYNLYVPSGEETGLKLVGGYTIPADSSVIFTAEFDLMKSVTAPDGLSPDVILRPTLRLVDNAEAGTLTGQVSNALVTAEGCDPSVYVFNDGIEPNAIDDGTDADLNDPVATAMVNAQLNSEEETEYHYTVGFLLFGDYEVAFTCDGAVFVPESGKGADIGVKTVTTVDFLD